jgi:RNA polymerase sigma-70 factor (sigma-E family)
MHTEPLPSTAALRWRQPAAGLADHDGAEPVAGLAGRDDAESVAAASVTALYEAHALGLVRLAHVMIGDRASAEDVVQDAFCGLYRRWDQLSDTRKALQYVRSSVLNGCRSTARRRRAPRSDGTVQPTEVSAETTVIAGEERREVMGALRRLPDRQREVLVLRFYLDLSEAEIACAMNISKSTVRSTGHRALAALGRSLRER